MPQHLNSYNKTDRSEKERRIKIYARRWSSFRYQSQRRTLTKPPIIMIQPKLYEEEAA